MYIYDIASSVSLSPPPVASQIMNLFHRFHSTSSPLFACSCGEFCLDSLTFQRTKHRSPSMVIGVGVTGVRGWGGWFGIDGVVCGVAAEIGVVCGFGAEISVEMG